MRILGIKHSHDANISLLNDGTLLFHLEAEKNSEYRHQTVTATLLARAMMLSGGAPDVFAASGWSSRDRLDAQYIGIPFGPVIKRPTALFGKQGHYFSSSHERSHIFCSYGLSPFPQGQPVYLLVYEGTLGRFYEIDERMEITPLGDALWYPGKRYELLFSIADTVDRGPHGLESNGAGRLMALAAYSDRSSPVGEEYGLISEIINEQSDARLFKKRFEGSRYYNIGVESPEFKNLAGKFSDELFGHFLGFAKRHCTKRYPLLIGGGCGLNCEWNTRWRESEIFSDLFIPPATNDVGCAIGTAIDAQFHYTGSAKVSWDVYAGELFDFDVPIPKRFIETPLNLAEVADLLAAGKVIAWIQGRYEMGPRALGNRSLLAAPFTSEMHERLNTIKRREMYRPIAPICLLEDVSDHFEWNGPSPYMLHFQRVKTDRLKAVTHVDGTARVQTVSAAENKLLHELLTAFKAKTGFGVLCNTSLNFPGRGFINQLSDLFEYQKAHTLDALVVEQRVFRPR